LFLGLSLLERYFGLELGTWVLGLGQLVLGFTRARHALVLARLLGSFGHYNDLGFGAFETSRLDTIGLGLS
jgi:hypothetical protein